MLGSGRWCGRLAFSTVVQFYKHAADGHTVFRLIGELTNGNDDGLLERVTALLNETMVFTPTWETGRVGNVGSHDDGSFILEGIPEMLDRFVLEYLRANETGCGGP